MTCLAREVDLSSDLNKSSAVFGDTVQERQEATHSRLPCVSSRHGSQLVTGIQAEVVDGHHSHHREPAVLCCAAGLGLAAHHAEEGRLLFSPLPW